MSTELFNPTRLAELNREIEQLASDSAQVERQRTQLAKAARNANRRWQYLRLARIIRSPTETFEMWPFGVMLVGPLLLGLLMFILSNLLGGSFGISFIGFLFGAGASAIAIAALLYRPTDPLLPAELSAADSERRVARARWEELVHSISADKKRLAELLEERRLLMASGKVQRAALLQREWKAMPAAEWEDFVVEVLRTLGAIVERTARRLDEPTALIGHFDSRRVAILTSGEGNNVNSETVQHSIAAKQRNGCHACAVIINRRFTGAAQDHARRNDCMLVGVEEFPDFVMGKMKL